MHHDFEEFGKYLFSEEVMKRKLPSPIYEKWRTSVKKEGVLDIQSADAIAHAMKEWAMELGATHFTHWFHPMNGLTAQKNESFLGRNKDGLPIARFSGKSLVKGEGDASSFPSGGLRATFEARGYTYWDFSSPAFVLHNVLCIPTVFVSYNGETLDKKAPLLKAMDALSKQATRIVNSFKEKDVKRVIMNTGLEQEYFLIDKKIAQKRLDLLNTGRTLVGNLPPKDQSTSDHYFGNIPTRVRKFMREVNLQLYRLGIYAQMEHNEVAPGQFEIAPIFSDANIAVDQNQLIMNTLRQVADQHNFVCILHEKPFKGVNGSGKHNNFSLICDDGQNLLEPGDKPHENIRFLLFVCAIIKAVDQHATLLRMASSNLNNDYRLGASEAPPAIISICLGDHIESILMQLKKGENLIQDINTTPIAISNLSLIPKDTSDRNRTSPFAFTGNKFEFRMLGSSLSAATTSTVISTIIADSLKEIADQLENIKYIQDIREESIKICRKIIKKHERILFSKDGYSQEWIEEAQKRGLPNIPHYIDSIESFVSKETIRLFEEHNVFKKHELEARATILYEQHHKKIRMESFTLLEMTRKEILPAMAKELYAISQTNQLAPTKYYTVKIEQLSQLIDTIANQADLVEQELVTLKSISDDKEKAFYAQNHLMISRSQLRQYIDSAEKIMSKENYPFPSYSDIFTSCY